MRRILAPLALFIASVFGTITVLAVCGSDFSPLAPNESNKTIYGTHCPGWGVKHTWHLTFTDGFVTDWPVVRDAYCDIGGPCWAEFETPGWMNEDKSLFGESVRDGYYSVGCHVSSGSETLTTQHHCSPADVEDEETCEANSWYWNFSNNSCQQSPPTEDCDYWAWWVCMQDHAVWYGYPECYCEYTPIIIDTAGN